MKIKFLMVLKEWTASILLPLSCLISQPKPVSCSRPRRANSSGPKGHLQWPSQTEDNKQRLHVRVNGSGDTDICQPWPLSWSLAGPQNCKDAPEPFAQSGRDAGISQGHRLIWIRGTRYSRPLIKGTCYKDKKPKRKGESRGVNKNRNRLHALTGKFLNASGPSASRNISLEAESHRQAFGLSVFATLTPRQRAVALLMQEMRGRVDGFPPPLPFHAGSPGGCVLVT